MKEIVITGANRGMGLEYVRQALEAGDRVFAGCRTPHTADLLKQYKEKYPERLFILSLDVTDECSVGAFQEEILRVHTKKIDLLINNAAYTSNCYFENIRNFKPKIMAQHFSINAMGPLLMVHYFFDMLLASENPKVINISSSVASLSETKVFRGYSYAASKTALNMISKTLSMETANTKIIIVMLHPGYVKTRPTNAAATTTPDQAITKLAQLIEGFTKADSGKFYNEDGVLIPW